MAPNNNNYYQYHLFRLRATRNSASAFRGGGADTIA